MSSYSLDKLELHCTWSAGNEKSVKDAMTIEPLENEITKSGIDDLVSLESCVQLFDPNSTPCTPELKFNVTHDLRICAIRIISEARIVELYGQGGEYLYTSHSDFVDEFEGLSVYSTLVRLTTPCTECSIGFKKFKHQDNFWLYGIGVYVKEVDTFGSQLENEGGSQSVRYNAPSQIDLNCVSERLQRSGRNISSSAEHCMQLLQSFQMIGRHRVGQAGDSEGCASNKPIAPEGSLKFCDLLLNMPPVGDRTKNTRPLHEELRKLSLSDSANAEIQCLISKHFEKLEEKLMGKMDDRLNVIEGKIDALTSLLQNFNQKSKADEDVGS
ncbi:hypothetical protein J437_LFUL008387 [Ladona fulva]|uniref:Uncharacterized protein n=1 Tax=Ladona fulva TaxID=123851 RepID=A0A8K0K8B3_LADFU|nr:hypothetical protein J437_LFUL008387 [Ladona fulva]